MNTIMIKSQAQFIKIDFTFSKLEIKDYYKFKEPAMVS